MIFKNAWLTIKPTGSTVTTNLSAYLRSVDFQYDAEDQDDTVMGDDTRSLAAGTLKVWSFGLELEQDFDDVDDILFAAVGNTAAINFRPSTAAKSVTNPQFTGTAKCGGYSPARGKVGDFLSVPFMLKNAGTLTRATT